MSLKLSEAIRLGSLLVDAPVAGDIRTCAIGMANLATNGYKAKSPNDYAAYNHLIDTWQWVFDVETVCPICEERLRQHKTIWHMFDSHVMQGEMTIEQLADWIATIEPEDVVVEMVTEPVTEYVHA